jgi:hypothetical protein
MPPPGVEPGFVVCPLVDILGVAVRFRVEEFPPLMISIGEGGLEVVGIVW